MTREVVTEDLWAAKGDVRLFLRRKRCVDPEGAAPRRPLVLVHGSSLSALPTFDLQVPERPDQSLMDWLARSGRDVWTLDHEGYGLSTVTASNADVATGVDDLRAALPVIAAATGAEKIDLYGLSSGSLRAACFAAAEPERVGRLVLDAFVWTGEGSPTLEKRRAGIDQFRQASRRRVDEAFLVGIFERDEPGTTDPVVARAVARAQLAYGDSVPTGTYLDMTTRLPLVQPEAIRCPTLIVRGEHDGIATEDDLLAFFCRLPAGDKAYVSLPGLAHVTPLGTRRHLLWATVADFLSRHPD